MWSFYHVALLLPARVFVHSRAKSEIKHKRNGCNPNRNALQLFHRKALRQRSTENDVETNAIQVYDLRLVARGKGDGVVLDTQTMADFVRLVRRYVPRKAARCKVLQCGM